MARPYILIQRDILEELEDLNHKGVPVRKLIRDYDLTIAAPTLTRLIGYLSLANRSIIDGKKSLATKELIYSSLFPEWLEVIDLDEVKQPSNWSYEGSMPLGKWVKKKGSTNDKRK